MSTEHSSLTPCPDDNALVAFVGREHVSDGLELHVATCSDCRKLVAEFVRVGGKTGGGARQDASEAQADVMRAGTTVDRYVIERLAGQGAMGRVYVALDPKLDRRIAIKILRRRQDQATDMGQRTQRFLREARALARLAHPHVVAIHDVGTDGDRVFIAMEFVEGSTLTDWLASPRSRDSTIDVLAQAGRGLAAAHRAGLVHRDFKPDNVLVGSDGRARVTDFGLARGALGMTPYDVDAHRHGLQALSPAHASAVSTGSGVVLGTPAYMSPEQKMGQWADARADQFAFCVVLYEALFGARPAAMHGTRGSIPQKTRGEEHVSADLARLLKRGLQEQPSHRFTSMDDVLHLLADVTTRRSLFGRRKMLPIAAAMMVSGVAALVHFGRAPGAKAERPHLDGRPSLAIDSPVGVNELAAEALAVRSEPPVAAARSAASVARGDVGFSAPAKELPSTASSARPVASLAPAIHRPKAPSSSPEVPTGARGLVADGDPFGAYE